MWCKDVLKYVERKLDGNRISDPSLVQMVDQAINLINRLSTSQPPLAEALFLRGDLLATGSFPSYHPRDLRTAFNDFELSARMGYAPSWFRIGRDYEVLEDMARARDAYERGCSVQDVGCIYRLGMANLLGQLELSTDHSRAIPLIREAADLANADTPQPSYVYGMLLAGEFNHVQVAKHLLLPTVNVTQVHLFEGEARKRIQRAAYLNFAPAQFRMGYLHEHAQLECSFDPLLSVQYYSLASQGGEVEADLALSKWFLCGAEGCFEKNESLAFTFADKAAAKGLASAEFAMGYYFEVGVGCEKELEVAKKWYRKAASHGNDDAKERLEALAGPDPNTLSRTQHEAHVDTQLQRKRTEAKMLSDRRSMRVKGRTSSAGSQGGDRPSFPAAAAPPPMPALPSQKQADSFSSTAASSSQRTSMEMRRRNTMRLVEETSQQSHPSNPINSQPSNLTASQQYPSQGAPPKPTKTPPPSTQRQYPHSQQYATPPQQTPQHRQNVSSMRPPQPSSTQNSPSTPIGGPRRGSGQAMGRSNKVAINTSPSKPTGSSGGGAGPNSHSIPVISAPSMGPDTKVYETFGEMGFAPNAAKVSGRFRC
jgi:TPR repeat protein